VPGILTAVPFDTYPWNISHLEIILLQTLPPALLELCVDLANPPKPYTVCTFVTFELARSSTSHAAA